MLTLLDKTEVPSINESRRWGADRLQAVATAQVGVNHVPSTVQEKFLYPQWTEIVLLIHPQIAAGLPIPLVTVIAGFVEFSLAFYLITGATLLRVDAALLRC